MEEEEGSPGEPWVIPAFMGGREEENQDRVVFFSGAKRSVSLGGCGAAGGQITKRRETRPLVVETSWPPHAPLPE